MQGLIGAPQCHVQGLKVPHSHMHCAYDYGALLTPAHDPGAHQLTPACVIVHMVVID